MHALPRSASGAEAPPAKRAPRTFGLLRGVLPFSASRLPGDLLAGITLAALGIPEVLGYAKIAGMPVVTGLYTILLPMAVFAVVGSSRHLVVGADSATAAILAAGIAGAAAIGSPEYAALAGVAALVTGAMLLLARLIRIGFLANFLSRTVLVGFLTGVGVQVAAGQLGEMIGVEARGHGTVGKLVAVGEALPRANVATVIVSVAVIAVVLGVRRVTRRVPGALIAVVGSIVLSAALDLPARGVAVLGPVPHGLPHLTLPPIGLHAITTVLGCAASMFVVVLAQSSATSRAYAARYGERFDEDADLVGLALANVAAALTGTFVVNGSPTKTEMVDSAGGRSQIAQLTTSLVVLLVLLFLTGPLAHLPLAVLATVVFTIGVELIDVRGMRRIFAVRRAEFVVALITAAAVVLIGVQQGIVLAIVASIVDHLRHSYSPRDSVLVRGADGRWRTEPAAPGVRTAPGLVVYRFGSSLYYANAQRLYEEALAFAGDGAPLRWLCVDCVAIGDVDYTAAAVLRRLHAQLARRGARLVLSQVSDAVRAELDRYGITSLLGDGALFGMPSDALRAFEAADASQSGK